MSDNIGFFITSLARALPVEDKREARNALLAMEPDIRKDFKEGDFRPGLAQEVAEKFDDLPTYFQLSVAIRQAIGAENQAEDTVRGPEVWASAFLSRWNTIQGRGQREVSRSAFMAYAPPEAIEIVRKRQPDAMKRTDEEKEDLRWWWRRVDWVESIELPELRLWHAIGMRNVLTESRNGLAPHPRPAIVKALGEIISSLEWQGVKPKAPVGTQRSIHKAAPPPAGPSGAEVAVDAAKAPTKPNPVLAAQIAAFRESQGIVPKPS